MNLEKENKKRRILAIIAISILIIGIFGNLFVIVLNKNIEAVRTSGILWFFYWIMLIRLSEGGK